MEYYNRVIDYIKSNHPNYKIVVHIYPDFRNDPLYGNRTQADYCGQTVSWYFKWDEDKIRKYTGYVLNHAKDYFPSVEGIPFIGINEAKNSSLAHKTPMEVEQELRIILASGSRTVMVCNGTAILEPGYYEVFKKYGGKEPEKSAQKKKSERLGKQSLRSKPYCPNPKHFFKWTLFEVLNHEKRAPPINFENFWSSFTS